ncbi:glycine--tRNA ligase [Candidatus Parcubacteria bacterium]|nr:glycine--tRNA ligase [Candidatus Parcubacteria bacterium]
MTNKTNMTNLTMDKIVSLCKRRGFVFPSSEIYGGFAAVYDYGPYGVELANNIKKEWWKAMVQEREDIVGLDSAIFTHPKVWQASGHVTGFADPLAECKNCHSRLRVDHLLEDAGIAADEKMALEEINKIFTQNKKKIKCPNCGKSDFSEVKKFNLLVKSNLGNFTEDWDKEPVYLRGETCQGIYVNYKNVLDTARVKIPFGIAQIGKAFRNEITARQFIFRTREFEQMEMQYFTSPKDEMKEYKKLKEYRWQFYLDLGIKKENLRWEKHKNLVFYAKEAYDIEYNFPFGFKELEGVHARGDYDLSQHQKFSGKDLSYADPITKEKYIPHIIESSGGVGRAFLAVLCDGYCEEVLNAPQSLSGDCGETKKGDCGETKKGDCGETRKGDCGETKKGDCCETKKNAPQSLSGDCGGTRNNDGETRVVLKLSKKLAPIKVAIFPLLKNKPELVKKAKEIFNSLKTRFMCEFDDHGNIGKRYRRQDEIGTPYCVTVDFESLEDNAVTVRDRDSMKQERVGIGELERYLRDKLK